MTRELPAETLRYLSLMSDEAKLAYALQLIREIEDQRSRARIWTYYPDGGPLRRELYHKHTEFFAAGLFHQERLYLAANRSGKTHTVCYEAALHMLGVYPSWWIGRRFARPVTVWFAGEDAKAVRESLQEKLLGRSGAYGTGLVPGDSLCDVRPRAGIPDAVDLFSVTHARGGKSRAMFKAYEQGRESFQSAGVDVIVLDEEPPVEIYTESLTRTLSTEPGKPSGLVMCSFTPLKGLSAVVLQFLPGGVMPSTEALRKQAWGW